MCLRVLVCACCRCCGRAFPFGGRPPPRYQRLPLAACCAHPAPAVPIAPARLAADAAAHAPKELTQEIVRLKGSAAAQKEAALLALCGKAFRAGRTIIFSKTKQRAHRCAEQRQQ